MFIRCKPKTTALNSNEMTQRNTKILRLKMVFALNPQQQKYRQNNIVLGRRTVSKGEQKIVMAIWKIQNHNRNFHISQRE